MTLAQLFKDMVDENLYNQEWYDGETELAQEANLWIAKNSFSGKGFKRGNEYHFNDGSRAKEQGVSVEIILA